LTPFFIGDPFSILNKKIRTFYGRLVNNHKPKKLAVIVAMRKLLLIAHAVYISKVPYREVA